MRDRERRENRRTSTFKNSQIRCLRETRRGMVTGVVPATSGTTGKREPSTNASAPYPLRPPSKNAKDSLRERIVPSTKVANRLRGPASLATPGMGINHPVSGMWPIIRITNPGTRPRNTPIRRERMPLIPETRSMRGITILEREPMSTAPSAFARTDTRETGRPRKVVVYK